jgi:hypothetical protein
MCFKILFHVLIGGCVPLGHLIENRYALLSYLKIMDNISAMVLSCLDNSVERQEVSGVKGFSFRNPGVRNTQRHIF